MTARVNRGPQPKALAIVAVIAAVGLALTFTVPSGGESSAEKRALDIANNVIPSVMDISDMAAPVQGSRYEQISIALEKTIADPNIERVTVWRKSEAVVYSTNADLVGLMASGMEAKPLIDEALAGNVNSSIGVGDAMPTDGSPTGESFRTFAPLRFQPGDPIIGVAEIVQPVPTGSDSQLVSNLKLAFNVILVVSLIWLFVAMGRPSEKVARARRYDEKLRRQTASPGSASAEYGARRPPAEMLPAADGPLFAGETPSRQTRTGPALAPPRGVGRQVAAMDTWAFGPGTPEPARRRPPRAKPTRPEVAEPASIEPAVTEPAAVEPAAVATTAAAIEPAVAEPAASSVPAIVGARIPRLGDADRDEDEHTGADVDPGAWIVPRSEQEARRREAMASGAPLPPQPEPATVEPAEMDAARAEAEREAAERAAAGAKERAEAEAKERAAAEAARLERAAEREAAQSILAAELAAMNAAADEPREEADAMEREAAEARKREAAEAKGREAAEAKGRETAEAKGRETAEVRTREEAEAAEKLAQAREAAAAEARLAREESARAAERALALRERVRAAEEAARAAREETSDLEADITRLEEARQAEARAQDKVRAAQDAARAAREEEFQLEEEARRLREGLRRF